MLARLFLGVALSIGVATVAWHLHALTCDGAVAAAIVGTLVLGVGGWPMAALLVLFFGTSSALTRWHAARKPHFEHRHGRSAIQVCANGIIATGLAVWSGFASLPWIGTAFAAAIAASTADTWATELGLLSARPPRLITTGRPVQPGRSGGVTWIGTLGGIAGAAVIGLAATLGLRTPFVPVWAAGSLAMLVDSLLGATVEDHYRGIDNNTVNLIMTVASALFAIVLVSR